MKIPVIVVCGATASGKTELAADIALAIDGEVVSADSMQVYKYMDIGSAKPTAEERKGIPHHMIDIAEPTESFSVVEYTHIAHGVIKDIYQRGKMPIIAGGTGLYINSVINDVDFTEEEGDSELRKELFKTAEENGAQYLHNILRELDPDAADAIHMNNVKRVVRAIEFYKLNNMRISEHSEQGKLKKSRYLPLMMDIAWDRQELYSRINRRVDIMYRDGLTDEVKRLIDMGCTRNMTSMQGIGYKETAAYLAGECTLEEAKENVKLATRRYAKRQLTWFRRDDRIIHMRPGTPVGTIKIAEDFCERKEWLKE